MPPPSSTAGSGFCGVPAFTTVPVPTCTQPSGSVGNGTGLDVPVPPAPELPPGTPPGPPPGPPVLAGVLVPGWPGAPLGRALTSDDPPAPACNPLPLVPPTRRMTPT